MVAKIKKNRNRNRYRVLFFPTLITLLVLLILGFLIFTNLNIARRRAELTERIEVLRKEIQVLEERNQELRDGIIRAGSEDFLEEKVREQLGLKKPGEEVVVILPPEAEAKEEPVEKEKSFWEKIREKLGF